MKKYFMRLKHTWPIPPLLSIQLDSYNSFLQIDYPPEKRKNEGLEALFREVFPIEDPHRHFILEYLSYEFSQPVYTIEEAIEKGLNYSIPLYANFRLIRKVPTKEEYRIKSAVEQKIFIMDLPLMTEQGTFIINGIERVVVSQLHRAPGIYLQREEGEDSILLVPLRGAWFEMRIDANDQMVVLLDRRRRIPIFTFFRALGYSLSEIFENLFPIEEKEIEVGDVIAERITGEEGRVYSDVGDEVTPGIYDFLISRNVKRAKCVRANSPGLSVILQSLKQDSTTSKEEALKKIFHRIRGIAAHSVEVAENVITGMLFDKRRFELGRCGRYRLNRIFNENVPLTETGLTREDIIKMTKRALMFHLRQLPPDDVDHLMARRVRAVGELLANHFRVALQQLTQNIRERAALLEDAQLTPQELINTRVVSSTVMKFFTQNPLSQFMEQTNPLASLIHKRRVSALGPGGLTKETAGFEIRDVHYSHYGRICPIETPEGPNIGLINTIATYAKIDEHGFITTPYWKVKDGIVTKEVEYVNPDEEENLTIAAVDTPIDEHRRIIAKEVIARRRGDVITVSPEEVTHMDISPKQLFSPSTILIPFLEHDDADRALMGANMQRQAVPLLMPERPLVATGVEKKWAEESGCLVLAPEDGEVIKIDSSRILLRTASGLREIRLQKFFKSNQYTSHNQKPVVKEGSKVKKGDLLADGASTDQGELALGRNVFVAFLPWRGYNYEDAIVISENLLREDAFTSIQILEFEIQARMTKLGPEEITRDIPGTREEDLANLDAFGIIRIGAEVIPGDILVGRITPRGETEFTPEERLLRAIFGEKAENYRDTSLRVEPGVYGTVIDVKVITRRDGTPLANDVFKKREAQILKRHEEKKLFIQNQRDERLRSILLGEKAATNVRDNKDRILLREGERFTEDFFASGKISKVKNFEKIVDSEKKLKEIEEILKDYETKRRLCEEELEREKEKLSRGDELPHGVLKWIRVFIAQKRRLSVGDKLANRHGGKGVVAKILPVEDMPFLPDGTPVDMVLNPLGVPSRMNIGQILETVLGWAAKKLGYQAISPPFEGPSVEEVKEELKKAGLPPDGKVTLYDGRTGLPFKEKVVVGYMYMMKLNHMVDDKIHARAVGRYSLITQQPLGGKAQFGGQRFGEMEVWALEAYGAAHALQEMLTIKSDDVEGRSELFESLFKGKLPPEPKIPASFSVLTKELRGLCLDLIPEKTKEKEKEKT
uniref:DNA-directed RNA polymerase subunit beta n=1 Tax=candidate division WOR-3 bacterium TaxID=2052148 RepID=A0A7C3UQI7_UNCW3